MKNENAIDEINKIMADWDSIGVDKVVKGIAMLEYKDYLIDIYDLRHKNEDLISYLENMLMNVMGVAYDPNNENHKNDLLNVVEKIMKVL